MTRRSLRTVITTSLLMSSVFFLLVVFSFSAKHRPSQFNQTPPLGSVNPQWGSINPQWEAANLQVISDAEFKKIILRDLRQAVLANPQLTDKQIYSNERLLIELDNELIKKLDKKMNLMQYHEWYLLQRQNLSSLSIHSPVFSASGCQDPLCLHLVSVKERAQFNDCSEATIRRRRLGQTHKGSCHFLRGSGRPIVALSSFPGSGNSWLRELLELATGVCTGATYCDPHLRNEGFTGEGVMGPSVIAVSMDRASPPQVRLCYQEHCYSRPPAIVLIRNPRNAIIANYTRHSGGHTGTFRQTDFGNNTDWSDCVTSSIKKWSDHTFSWFNASKTTPTLLVQYEDLQTNTVMEMKRVLHFLGVDPEPTLEQLEDRLSKGFEKFHRTNPAVNIEYFTPSQEMLVKEAINRTVTMLRKSHLDKSFIAAIENYLYIT